MLRIPLAAVISCLAVAALFTALVVLVATEYLNEMEDHP